MLYLIEQRSAALKQVGETQMSEPQAVEQEEPRGQTPDGDQKQETASPGGDDVPTLDVVFQTLKNSRRRRVLKYLSENGGTSTLSDLAEHIAAIENGTTPQQLTSSERKRVYVGLYQCHLPKMDDVGVINYDQSRGDIKLTDQITHFEQYLGSDETTESTPWYQYYAAVSGVGLAVLLTTIGAFGSAVAAQAVAVGTIGLVALCSAYHWQTEQTA